MMKPLVSVFVIITISGVFSSAQAQVAGLPGAFLQQEMQRQTQPEVYAPWAFQAQGKLKPSKQEPVQIIREQTEAEMMPSQKAGSEPEVQ